MMNGTNLGHELAELQPEAGLPITYLYPSSFTLKPKRKFQHSAAASIFVVLYAIPRLVNRLC